MKVNRKIITLLTDFGTQDGYAGVMKGVIWGIAPQVYIADLTHDIYPQDVKQGAFVLGRSAPYFPRGSIHVAVVDPGVGTQRRPLAARLGDCFFVGPDNGLLTPLLYRAERMGGSVEVVHLTRREYWLPEVSSVFHGRDIFAPVSAHLANDTPLSDLGAPVDDPLRLEQPYPFPLDKGWRGQVTHVDHFGNLETNIERNHLVGFIKPPQVRIGDTLIKGVVNTFGDGLPGQMVALIDSGGHLSLCVVNGNAAETLHARVGDTVEVVV